MTLLLEYLDMCMSFAEMANKTSPGDRIFFDQAFGAVQYYCIAHPEDQEEVDKLWEEYRQDFNKLIYGA